MSEAKHTAGPWMVEPINSGLTYQVTTSEQTGFKVICETDWGDDDDAANARLIAAAPDHAMICWAMCVQDATWEEWDANGRGEFCFCGLRYATQIDEFGAPVLTPALRAAIAKARAPRREAPAVNCSGHLPSGTGCGNCPRCRAWEDACEGEDRA